MNARYARVNTIFHKSIDIHHKEQLYMSVVNIKFAAICEENNV